MFLIFLISFQINVTLLKKDQFGIESPLLEVDLLRLGSQVSIRQYDLSVLANVGTVTVKEMVHGIDGEALELVSTPADADILNVKYIEVKFEACCDNLCVLLLNCCHASNILVMY